MKDQLTILNGDCRAMLKTLPDESVHCVVTSPPYWGLRDYRLEPLVWGGKPECGHEWVGFIQPAANGITHDRGMSPDTLSNTSATRGIKKSDFCECGAWRGSYGLEPTIDLYLDHTLEIFREVRRVLRSDGTLFLNLGDSYYSNPNKGGSGTFNGRNGRGEGYARALRGAACDTSDKAPVGSQGHDCLCGSLCDACRGAYRIGKSHSGSLHAPKPEPSLYATNRKHRESRSDHLPTLDSLSQEDRSGAATLDSGQTQDRERERPLVSPVSTIDGFSQQLPAGSLPSAPPSECLLCGCSLRDSTQAFVDTSIGQSGQRLTSPSIQGLRRSKNGITSTDDASDSHSLGKTCGYCSHLDYTTTSHHALKPKDLCGMPWRVAFALQADGWWLRSDIVWAKPNPMPESVTDRPTRSHEYIFLLTKNTQYFYDAEAIKEPASASTNARISQDLASQVGSFRANGGNKTNGPMKAVMKGTTRKISEAGSGVANNRSFEAALPLVVGSRNKRSVWTITTESYSEAHFATFPSKLVEPCILAGTSAKGCCPDCGAPWERVVEGVPNRDSWNGSRFDDGKNLEVHPNVGRSREPYQQGAYKDRPQSEPRGPNHNFGYGEEKQTTGWQPTCKHDGEPVPCTVLDIFGGSGTVGKVALKLARNAILIELSPEYVKLIKKRCAITPGLVLT